ncbi:MAG: hypothetical protein HC904_07085 [Blastochloris sp.]|nr:hypothetical protein [Blastochloris sp.]
MKFVWMTLGLLGLTLSGVEARLGESPEQLEKRFGKPLQQVPAGVGDLRQYVYLNKDLMITILVTGNESVLEQYVRLKETPKPGQEPVLLPIPEALGQAILGRNAEGSSWEPYESNATLRRFVRKDQKAFGSFAMEKGSITEVRISSKDMVDFAEKLRKSKAN